MRDTHAATEGRNWRRAAALALVLGILGICGMAGAETELDNFEDVSGWTATASPGARVEIARDTGHTGMGMRIDFDLGAGGYVIARKAFALPLPRNYAFKFFVRGNAAPNHFEFKLVDHNGRNVWWYNQRQFNFPTAWRLVTVKKPRLRFAWGPAGGGAPTSIGYIEFAISAGTGGRGSVWIDDLRLEERPPPVRSDMPPQVSASTSVPGHEPQHIVDPEPRASWHSGTLAPSQWVLLDFKRTREYGGLIIDWGVADFATAYKIDASDDGKTWTTAYSCAASNGGRNYIYLPDGESRYLRLDLERSSRGQGYEIRRLSVEPFEFSASPNQFFTAIAKDAAPGMYPKYFSGVQTYWTVVGVDGDSKKALLNEEGMLEVDKGGFSIEPFLSVGGTLVTWHDVQPSPGLADGYLPIPSVRWRRGALALTITALATGRPGASALAAQYRVENSGTAAQTLDLFLAIRPFQVLPPWQSLNIAGGVSPIHDLWRDDRTVWVNRQTPVVSLTPPDGFGAATFDEGRVTDFLVQDLLPPQARVSDPLGYASGALRYHLTVAPGMHADVQIVVPFHRSNDTARDTPFAARLADATSYWTELLDRVEFSVPPAGLRITNSLKSTLAYILINRNGPALQPGARNYARSWIRDGAMTSTALLELGCPDVVRAFLQWYAPYQFPDGRIPCCVDRRGADRVPENDSDGEFIYAVAEYYRYTHDIGFVHEMWPTIVKAVASIAALRQERLTAAYQRPEKRAYYGLLPESISHEGYSSHPVHSYWDDFFALRGLKDAASLARVAGDEAQAAEFAALRDAFSTDLYASIQRTMTDHKISYLPASVELADFDPSSTAIALTLGGEQARLPQVALKHTFDEYYAHVQERLRSGTRGDDAYSPYELRNVGALVRLGERQRAFEILNILLHGQRPPTWNQWAEVVWRERTAPRFIGDMPHTWVGASFIESVRTMFAYEREADAALVIAAGIPPAWIVDGPGVGVRRLPTQFGVLNYTLRRDGSHSLHLTLAGDLTLPSGGIVVQPPLPQPLKSVTVNGRGITTFTADRATVEQFPADVVLSY